jgi:murein DD-endopeptidase MepM/ murein hydrolase activator NlpD
LGRFWIAVLFVTGAFAPLWSIDWTRSEPGTSPFSPLFAPIFSSRIDRFELPPPSPPEATETSKRVTIKAGDTLAEILTKNRVPAKEAQAAITALTKVYNAKNIKPGQEVEIAFVSFQADTNVSRVTLHPSVSQEITVRRDDDGAYTAEREDKVVEKRMHAAGGTIEDSFYVSAVKLGVQPGILMDMIKMLSWDVDFQRDIQPGDRFEVMYERFYTEGGAFVRTGDLLYANLILSGKSHAIYRHTSKGGTVDYYDAKGVSARKALLRTPIDGARLTSSFGSRLHPILGYTTMHRGVDFAAPAGTPIYAAGDGVIEVREREGAYGNYIRVRHTPDYATAYAHMSRFAPRIVKGSRVKQGQVIGYVGTTGRSTGPHLHFEVLHKNQQINPMAVKMPEGGKLAGLEFDRFMQQRSRIGTTFDRLIAPNALVATNP